MRTYEIEEKIIAVLSRMEGGAVTEDGEVLTDESLLTELADLNMARDKKLLDVACWIKDLVKDEKALKDEISTLRDRATAKANKVKSLKNWLNFHVGTEEKLEDSRAVISHRKSESVLVNVDPDKLPEVFQRIKIDADKTAIKSQLKAGGEVDGCTLEKKINISIK